MVDWVRLWHDMPTDPKWRVIARKSGQPLANVIALFTLLMTTASAADERGSITQFSAEDAAAALDLDEEDVQAILSAMEGRVIENQRLSGWERRQPKREDAGASERKQRFKERSGTHENAPERIGTQENASERPREETDTDTEQNILAPKGACPPKADALPLLEAEAPSEAPPSKPRDFDVWWQAYPSKVGKLKAEPAFRTAVQRIRKDGRDPLPVMLEGLARAMESARWNDPTYTKPNPTTWLNRGGWDDDYGPPLKAPSSGAGISASSELLARHNALMNRKAAA